MAAILERLRREVEARPPEAVPADVRRPPQVSPARREAQRLWAVTAERPYPVSAGSWGRTRGLLLLPLKAVLRRMMRWYVEPVAADQRAVNAALLRLVDELDERVAVLEEQTRHERPAADEQSRTPASDQ